jgi:hypothetical protein
VTERLVSSSPRPIRPACGRLCRRRKTLCHLQRGGIERAIAFADRTQRHVDGFFDEVAAIGRAALDEYETQPERLVGCTLVMDGEAPQQRKRRSLDELFATVRPLFDLPPRVGRAIEEGKADRVADRPVIEVAAPAVHLCGRHGSWFVHVRRERPRFVPAVVPERGGKVVTSSKPSREGLDVGHGYAEGVGRRDRVSCHPVPVRPGAMAFQPIERLLRLSLSRRLAPGS